MSRFENRTTVVTGAVGGIGSATCRRIADEGGRLVLTDVDENALEDLRQGLPRPDEHLTAVVDVTMESSWQALADRLQREGVPIHALVNNAGIGGGGTVLDETMEMWDRLIAVNQTGVWLGMKIIGPLVQGENPGGSIVNLSSVLGAIAERGGLTFGYQATKGAVRVMTKSAALYWADKGIRVNSVHPGYTGTPNLLGRYQGTAVGDTWLRDIPMGRFGRPEEIAAAVAFLASADSSYVSGAELYVDGALTAH